MEGFTHRAARTIIAALIATLTVASAAAAAPVILDGTTARVNISSRGEVAEDPSRRLDLDGARKLDWTPNAGEAVNFGYSRSAIWVRFTIENRTDRSDWLLEIDYPIIDVIDLYVPRADGGYDVRHGGESVPVPERDQAYQNTIFALTLPPGSVSTFYLRYHDEGSILCPIVLWKPKAFAGKGFLSRLGLGIYLGIMLVMVFYNLFLFATVRDRGYLYYILYVAAFAITFMFWLGLIQQHVAPGIGVWWYNRLFMISGALMMICLSLFTRTYLRSAIHAPRLDRTLIGIMIIQAAHVVLYFFGDFNLLTQTLSLAVMGSLISYVALTVIALRKRYRPARFYAIAFSVLTTGALAWLLRHFTLIPSNGLTENAILVGSAMEVTLLSLGLGDRINRERREKYRAREEAIAAQQEAIEGLRAADRLKDEFLSNTSHELRTPLHGIIGIAESLIGGAAGALPASAAAELALVVSSGRRLESLVNDLLDFSKLRNRDIALRTGPVDMREVAAVVLALSAPLVGTKPLVLRNEIPADLPPALGDENRLQQVMHNLVGNAIKFTPAGEVTVRAATVTIGGAPFVEVAVADTGIGVAPGSAERIFRAFEQADGSIEREYGGTGLGLAITKSLVELHGGTIRVSPRDGGGTVFTFTLPRADGETGTQRTGQDTVGGEAILPRPRSAASPVVIAEPAAHPEGQLAPNLTGATVLVVDDETLNRHVVTTTLTLAGITVIEAADGHEALAIMETRVPDVVLLDVMMPRMNGYETARRIRTRFTRDEVPIIFLTARNQARDLSDGFFAGGNDYIVKPFSRDELLVRINFHVSFRSAIQESRRLFSIRKELDIARAIQQSIIPSYVPRTGRCELAVRYHPMEGIGGDYYDFVVFEGDAIGTLITDVSGHGVPAALIASMLRIVFQMIRDMGTDPAALLTAMNRILVGNIGTQFITAGYAYVDAAGGRLYYARAGHEPALVLRHDGTVTELCPRGRAIGWIDDARIGVEECAIGPGERIILYTDGVIETMNTAGELFGRERFAALARERAGAPAQTFITDLFSELAAWAGGHESFTDDITIVAIDVR